MFYLLSKVLDVALTPLAWATVLVLLGVARRHGRHLALLGLVVLLGFSMEPVSNWLFRGLEEPPRKTYRSDVTYDVVVLLGGLTEDRVEDTWGQRAFNDSNERLLETFDLLRTGKAKNVIVSGGAVWPDRVKQVEARVLADQLIAWGVDPARVVVEDQARNTHENAMRTAAIVRERGWKRALVVTSAFHMRRAYGCFQAEGLPIDTLPVDFRSFGRGYPADRLPRAEYLQASTAAIREYAGRYVYRLRGYSQ